MLSVIIPQIKHASSLAVAATAIIFLFPMPDKFIIPASQPGIPPVCIRYDFRRIAIFAFARNSFDLCPTAPLHIPRDASINSWRRCLFPALEIPVLFCFFPHWNVRQVPVPEMLHMCFPFCENG